MEEKDKVHDLVISVSDPHKKGDGMNSFMSYKVKTKVKVYIHLYSTNGMESAVHLCECYLLSTFFMGRMMYGRGRDSGSSCYLTSYLKYNHAVCQYSVTRCHSGDVISFHYLMARCLCYEVTALVHM